MLGKYYLRKTTIHEKLLVSAQSDMLDKMFFYKTFAGFLAILVYIGTALEFEIVQTLNTLLNSI